ncbi:MAG: hypothetical protein WAM91_13195 [Candidatus Acidiferrales bacterium]
MKGKANGKNAKMDARARKALLVLARRVKKNTPIIEKRLRAAGVEPNPALVFAAAMNLGALDRLAREDDEDKPKSAPPR